MMPNDRTEMLEQAYRNAIFRALQDIRRKPGHTDAAENDEPMQGDSDRSVSEREGTE